MIHSSSWGSVTPVRPPCSEDLSFVPTGVAPLSTWPGEGIPKSRGRLCTHRSHTDRGGTQGGKRGPRKRNKEEEELHFVISCLHHQPPYPVLSQLVCFPPWCLVSFLTTHTSFLWLPVTANKSLLHAVPKVVQAPASFSLRRPLSYISAPAAARDSQCLSRAPLGGRLPSLQSEYCPSGHVMNTSWSPRRNLARGWVVKKIS